MKPIITILCLLTGTAFMPVGAQVHMDKPLVLIADDPEQRRVGGLPQSQEGNAVMTAATEQDGTLRFVGTPSGAAWAVTVQGLLEAPVAGTQILVQPSAAGNGAVSILVNASGPYELRWPDGQVVLAEQLEAGEVISLVFDGTAFQVLSGRVHQRRPCPTGTVSVNDQYCVEQAQRGALVWEQAVLTCTNLGLRMCTWGEFSAACERRVELGILAPGQDWEWTNNSANSAQNVRVVRYAATPTFPACTSAGTRNMTGPAAPYRCCYTR